MNSSTTADRRGAGETSLRIETAVTPVSASHFFICAGGEDIAAGGVFIATDRPLAVGDAIGVELALHAYVLFFHGTVRWCTADGVGVTFDDISAPARRVIESFCERRRAAVVYDDDGRAVTRH